MLRGITLDVVGAFTEAVGWKYSAGTITQTFDGIKTGNARLRECSFLFFSVARVFGKDSAPHR